MNVNNTKLVQIVEDIIPTISIQNELTTSSNVAKVKCESDSDAIIFRGEDGLGTAYIRTNQNGSVVMAQIPQLKTGSTNKCFTTLSDILEAGKQFTSTTIVNGADTLQSDMDVTTIHVPILGLEEAVDPLQIESYDTTLGIPVAVETLEVPVEALMSENDEIQTIHIGDYTTVANSLGSVQDLQPHQQPMVIASTDSQGNCYVTLQDNQVLSNSTNWKERTQGPTITKVGRTRSNVGTRGFVRCGRSRMIADQLTNITVSEYKAQLSDTSDIMGRLELAPSTKKMMHFLQNKGIGKLFASPGKTFYSKRLAKLFSRHLKTRLLPVEETFTDMQLLPLGYQPEVDPTKIKRITRRRRYPEAEEYQRRMIQEQMQQTFDNLVAESHKNMEAMFLENSATIEGDNQGSLQVLVEAAENGSFNQNNPERVVDIYGNEDISDNSIIVIHDGQETAEGTAYTQQNIEVLLAAAGESGVDQENIHQVIICQQGAGSESFLSGNNSIIIVPNDSLMETITETVMTS